MAIEKNGPDLEERPNSLSAIDRAIHAERLADLQGA